MTEFRSAFVDTSPFIYYIEKSELYFEKMKSWFSQCYELEKSLITSPITFEEYCIFHLRNQQFEYIHAFRSFIADMEIAVNFIDRDTAFLAPNCVQSIKELKLWTLYSLQVQCRINAISF